MLSATVALRCGPRIGAGFFVASNEVVTNLHVSGQGGDPIEVQLREGQTASAWVERSSERLDVALLRVSGLTAPPLPLPLGDATSLGPGSPVLAAGSPVGLDFTVTQAILSHAERTILGVVYLQFDGSVNPGNSGGPLVDDAGRAIGIVSMKAHGASGISLALPVNYLVAGTEVRMKDHGITADVYYSAVRLGMGGCPAQEFLYGATLELDGGDPKAVERGDQGGVVNRGPRSALAGAGSD